MRKFLAAIILISSLFSAASSVALEKITKLASLPVAQWQKTASFPDWLGHVDDTLAINNTISFNFWHAQGKIYLKTSERLKSFDMFVNSTRIETSEIKRAGIYEIDVSELMLDGVNTIQISNINPEKDKNVISVYVPYPVILRGSLEESGIRSEALELVSEIIDSDIARGFPSAQLAIIRNGRLVYSKSWGKNITTRTLYDLASISKMLGVNYAIQKLVSEKRLDIDAKVSDIFGREMTNAQFTLRDLLCHRSGLPPEIYYHDMNYDISKRKHDAKVSNPLYTGIDGSPETRAKTLRAILRTPLINRPGAKVVYSDVGYMLLCFVVEKVTGQTLDTYMRENFWQPLGLNRITYNPLKNNFSREDCAPTEIYGNTRDGNMTFTGIRNYVLQGEVHDYKAFHSMGGISGHAGLFSNAEDLAILASLMFYGGYGEHKFFTRDVIDFFTAIQALEISNYAIGWWREGDDKRAYYFGTQSRSSVFGHQGWTGTLIMIDPSRNLVIAYLTNKINSPVVKPYTGKKIYAGNWFTASTLGFVPQIISIGMDSDKDISEQLNALVSDMAIDSMKLIPKNAAKNHPANLNAESKRAILKKRF